MEAFLASCDVDTAISESQYQPGCLPSDIISRQYMLHAFQASVVEPKSFYTRFFSVPLHFNFCLSHSQALQCVAIARARI